MREALCTVAGAPSSAVPGGGALLAIAVLAGALSPPTAQSLRAIRTRGTWLAMAFHHRYGHLINLHV